MLSSASRDCVVCSHHGYHLARALVFDKWKRWQTQKFLDEAESVQRCPAAGCSLAVKYRLGLCACASHSQP